MRIYQSNNPYRYILLLSTVFIVLQFPLFAMGEGEKIDLSEEEQILTAELDVIKPDGELGAMFSVKGNTGKEYSKAQKSAKKQEVVGKIVQWTLEVYRTKKDGDAYRIQNVSKAGLLSAFIYITPGSKQEQTRIENLKRGDVVTVKGTISGFSLGSVFVIKPAFLLEDKE